MYMEDDGVVYAHLANLMCPGCQQVFTLYLTLEQWQGDESIWCPSCGEFESRVVFPTKKTLIRRLRGEDLPISPEFQ